MSLRNLQIQKGKTSQPYSPTVSGETDGTAVIIGVGFLSISGDIVTCQAAFTTTPSVANALMTFELSLPFPINVQNAEDILGVAGNSAGQEYGGSVIGSTGNNTAVVGTTHDAGGEVTTVQFSYRVIV